MTAHGMTGLATLRNSVTRSISPENRTGGKGAGGAAEDGTGAQAAADLGRGWKISPSINIEPGETAEIANITGPGTIQHMWFTTHKANWRRLILRIHWENAAQPAVEVPYGDFFGQGWCEFSQLSSASVAANPYGGFNSYWEMPFSAAAKITLQNIGTEPGLMFFQIDYELGEIADNHAYFHAQWRRSNPLPDRQVHTILDGVTGTGHYVGTYLAWGVNSNGWWGEGEVKFYLDGDDEFPTICGTGTEDYFGGAWAFNIPDQGYTEFSTPHLGLHQILRPDGLYQSQQRFGMYRWHVLDPIRFSTDLRVTIQGLGWRAGRFIPLRDDISSTCFWYQNEPNGIESVNLTPDYLEVR